MIVLSYNDAWSCLKENYYLKFREMVSRIQLSISVLQLFHHLPFGSFATL